MIVKLNLKKVDLGAHVEAEEAEKTFKLSVH